MLPPYVPPSGDIGRHEDNCDNALCCRCQSRPWTTHLGVERLCGLCAACCQMCGRLPARHLDGLPDGVCATCRGECQRCRRRLDAESVEHHKTECSDCRLVHARPGPDRIQFVLRAMPRLLLNALHHRLPAVILQVTDAELYRRSPQQLYDRIERRWYGRWSHALGEIDAETGRNRWSPDDIAYQLVAPGPCSAPDCEDGLIQGTDRACPACCRPEFRFTNPPARSTPETRAQAVTDMRNALRASPYRTGSAARPKVNGPRAPGDHQAMDNALAQARAQLTDPSRPRLTEPPLPPEPGPDDSRILQARAEREAQEQDPARQAALARARAERAGRTRKTR